MRQDIISKLATIKDAASWCEVCDTFYQYARDNQDTELLSRLDRKSKWIARMEEADAGCI